MFVLPTLQSLSVSWVIGRLSRLGFVESGYPTAWDRLVLGRLRKQPSLIAITLRDGRRIGGGFAGTGYASNFPYRRDLLVDRLWEIDQETGAFIRPISGQVSLYVCGKDILTMEVFDAPTVLEEVGDSTSANT